MKQDVQELLDLIEIASELEGEDEDQDQGCLDFPTRQEQKDKVEGEDDEGSSPD